jgi:diguanylate cyclase (GGDEF)-like protein/PAS domain S-box-containing protein
MSAEDQDKRSRMRAEAEARLEYDQTRRTPPGSADLPRHLHELRVHQIELEMQNEELRLAHDELEQARDRYADLYDFAPVGYLTLDQNGMVDALNLTAARMLGVDRGNMHYRRFDRFVAMQERDRWHRHYMGLLKSGEPGCIELELLPVEGTPFHARLECAHHDLDGAHTEVRVALSDITERHLADLALKESEALLKSSHVIAGLGSYVLDIPANRWKSSGMLDKLFGIGHDYERSVEGWAALIHPDDRVPTLDYFRNEVLIRGQAFDHKYRIVRQNDRAERWLHGQGKLERDAQGYPAKMFGTIQDITERHLAEMDLRIAATAFQSQGGIVVTDVEGTILRVNQAYSAITGYSAEEAVGQNPRMLQSGRQNAEFYKTMWATILRTGSWEGEVWNKRKNGEVFPEHLAITAVKNAAGTTTHYVGTLADITLSRQAADEIRHLAYYDTLTRLPNRRLLQDRLKQAMIASARSGRPCALLFLDLDDFKTLNDTLGHDIGDMLLQQAAQRLEACVREGDTVARLGGDEFVVMLENLNEQRLEAAVQAEAIGAKILAALTLPYRIAQHGCRGSTSIGAVLFMGHEQKSEELLKQADIAMYQAKKAGRNRLCFFDQSMQDAINTRAALEADLRRALDENQLQLHYQIQVDSSGKPLGAEALIRWLHPQRGMISPLQFIPFAEESGLILPIGLWVLETASAQLNAWQRDAKTRDLTLAINVSARQFHQPDFVAQVQSAVARHAVRPERLKLEITESMLLENIGGVIATMNTLQQLGVRFALDDFGTGYSSLQYLKHLPLDQLKIDRSFVRDIEIDPNDHAIVGTIIAMAHSLGLNVIAEGVETNAQLQLLLGKGCPHYQGFLFGKPMPIDEFEAQLATVAKR